MTPEQFVKCFWRSKQDALRSYLDPSSGTEVTRLIATLNCSPNQLSVIKSMLDAALTDALYTVLLGLDGCASLGGVQQCYRVIDEQNSVVCSGDGTIEGFAYEYFQERSGSDR